MALVAGGCAAPAGEPLLRVAPGCDGCSAVVSQGGVRPNEPVSFGSIILCLGQPGSVTVTDVALVGVEGSLRLDAFGVRPNPFIRNQPALGAERGRLVDLGFDPAKAQVVDATCVSKAEDITPTSAGSELGVELSYLDGAIARSASLEVTYVDAASHRSSTLPINMGFGLCRQAWCPSADATPASLAP